MKVTHHRVPDKKTKASRHPAERLQWGMRGSIAGAGGIAGFGRFRFDDMAKYGIIYHNEHRASIAPWICCQHPISPVAPCRAQSLGEHPAPARRPPSGDPSPAFPTIRFLSLPAPGGRKSGLIKPYQGKKIPENPLNNIIRITQFPRSQGVMDGQTNRHKRWI
jgi:hypothetical protein